MHTKSKKSFAISSSDWRFFNAKVKGILRAKSEAGWCFVPWIRW